MECGCQSDKRISGLGCPGVSGNRKVQKGVVCGGMNSDHFRKLPVERNVTCEGDTRTLAR
jgi:hypothetical protein